MSEKIKVVVGINDFRIGGAQKLAADVLMNLDTRRFDIYLITLMQFNEQPSFYDRIPNHIKIHKLNFKGFRDLGSWWVLFKLMRDIKPDVVWSNLFFGNTIFRCLKLLLNYSVISIEQNTYLWKTHLHKIADRFLSLCSYRIVAVSKYVLEYTSKEEGISKDKFVLIHNGTDVQEMQKQVSSFEKESVKRELGFLPEDKLIINVGQLIEQKNQELLISSFKEFLKTNTQYKLLILGEGVLRPSLEAQIDSSGLTGKVFLMGIQKNIPKFHSASDFFVLSSLFEGFPVVVIEALACGLPVISTPVAGSDEYIIEGQNGSVVESDLESLAKGMSKIANLTDEEKTAYRNSAKKIAQIFDIKAITKSYEKLFNEAYRDKLK